MALRKNISISLFGKSVVFDMSYVKIIQLEGNKENLNVRYAYFDQKDGTFIQKNMSNFVPSMSGDNFIKQAYLHLKSLAEFQDATDDV